MKRRCALLVLAALFAFGTSSTAGAQAGAGAMNGLAPAARAEVQRIVDSARVAGIPLDPLYAKVAEGQLKDAKDPEIVAAVRSLARRFIDVRAALGPSLDAGAMSAAATALRGGVPMSKIQQLAKASSGPPHANADLTVALITLADLMEQRVPMEPALTSIESLLRKRAPDDQFVRLRLAVQADIVGGRTPEAAVRARTELIMRGIWP
jgi:hypothetical protein